MTEGFTNADWLDHLQKGSLPLDTAPFFFWRKPCD
jgi:hypothetical protein